MARVGVRPTAIRWAPPRPVEFRVGPVTRIVDSDAPDATGPGVIAYAGNCVLVQDDVGPVVAGRPGLIQRGGQLGAVGGRVGQWLGQFSTSDGATKTVAVVNGTIWTYNWGTETWTQVVTAANLSSAGVTVSATAKVYATQVGDHLVLSDGVNLAVSWDGTTGSGGLTKLTNAPVFYGPICTYYGKLFGIKNTDRVTLVWSEEGDETTGYETGGYNNAWSLRQTDADPLTAIAATNDQLIAFRRSSTTSIKGAVSDAFATTGTRDGISASIGTASPASVLAWDNYVYFLGSDRHLYRVGAGGLEEVGQGHRAALAAVPVSKLGSAEAFAWYGAPDQRYIGFGVVEDSQTYLSRYVMLDADTGRAAGTWFGMLTQRWGLVEDVEGQLWTACMSGATSTSATDGYCYTMGLLNGSVWVDQFATSDEAITHQLQSGFLGWDESVDKLWDRCDLSLVMKTDLSLATITYVTPRTASSAQTLPTVAGVQGSKWDNFLWNTGTWADSAAVEQKVSVGWNGQGRWLQFTVAHDTPGEQFGFQSARVWAVPLDTNPLTT